MTDRGLMCTKSMTDTECISHVSQIVISIQTYVLLLDRYQTFTQLVFKTHYLQCGMTSLYRVDNQLQEKSWPSTSKWLWLYRIAAQKEKYRPKKRKVSPLLELPLELRLMIYDHIVLDRELNITKRHDGYRLPSLFRIHPQITREIYQLCPLTTVVDIVAPSPRSLWAIFGPSNIWAILVSSWRFQLALTSACKFRTVAERKQLAMNVRVRCVGCERECKGLDSDEPCVWCDVIVKNFKEPGFHQMCQLC